jgi:hypothetical protein
VNTLEQQCANPGRVVAPAAKFCTMTPNIFSIPISEFPPLQIRTKMCYHFTCAEQKAPDNSQVNKPPQNLDPQNGPRFMTPFWPQIFEKFVGHNDIS